MVYPTPLSGFFRIPWYLSSFLKFRRLTKIDKGMPVRFVDSYPCLADNTANTSFDAHYFYQGVWLSRKISEYIPLKHIDVSSSVMTIGVLSAFVDTVFIDYRPLLVSIENLESRQGDVTCLPFASQSLSSISCLHVIEHIGLGRYGDVIDVRGSERAAAELSRVLAPGGSLFLSTPVGYSRVCFNAHRVFSPALVCAMFSELRLSSFSCVDDDGEIHENVEISVAEGYSYGCGLFEFKRD